jgi:YD repeat-containing protein
VYAYDDMNHLLSKTADAFFSTGACAGNACGATQVSFTYTDTGKRLTMADLTGTTTYSYEPGSDRLAGKTTPFGNVTWTYDVGGNLTRIGGSGIGATYTYDVLNRLSSASTSFVGPVNYGYDEVGNLASVKTDSLTTTTYSYDPQNRLTQMINLVQHNQRRLRPGRDSEGKLRLYARAGR